MCSWAPALTFRDCFSHKRHCFFVYFPSTFLPLPHALFLSLSLLSLALSIHLSLDLSISASLLFLLSFYISLLSFCISPFSNSSSSLFHSPCLSLHLLSCSPRIHMCVSFPLSLWMLPPPRANTDLQPKCSFPFLTQP